MNNYENIELAKDVIREAGEYIKSKINLPVVVDSEVGRDIKLELDKSTEKLIVDKLKARTDYHILTEEMGFIKGNGKSDLTWIIDPIDGSLNFSRGIPIYCISIGLWNGQEPILGAVYDLYNALLYYGSVTGQAYMNDQLINVSKIDAKDKSIIATGFPVYSSFDDESLKEFVSKVQHFKKIRLLGSAALSIVYVARGSIEAYMENNIALWDVAGAIPIALAAGGAYEYSEGKNKYLLNVTVTNGKL